MGDVVGGRGGGHAQELLAGLVVGLLVDEHVGAEGAGRVGEGGQVVVVDPHQRGRVGGLVRGLGHHHRHRLAVVADLALGQDGVVWDYVAEATAQVAEVVGGDHRDHAGGGLGLGPVDPGDAGVGPLGAHNGGVGHVGQGHVDGVPGPPSDLLPCVAPRYRCHGLRSGPRSRIRTTAAGASVSRPGCPAADTETARQGGPTPATSADGTRPGCPAAAITGRPPRSQPQPQAG
ncbi:MAG: hypothetical protein OXG66_11345 [Acidimicrobiaceae bacterium]|nr:hypothetical protein [Acidimicrobiaceae bacterium]